MTVKHHQAANSTKDKAGTIQSFAYSGRLMEKELPKYEMPKESNNPRTVYQIIHDELALDCNPSLNLATFVTNWMEPEANDLLLECASKNYADMSCYTQTTEIEGRCVSILSHLWNSPSISKESIGTYCVGSSEACLLGALAMKKIWQHKRSSENKDYFHPNIVMPSTVQVVWKKFATYFDVEPRYAIISEYKLDSNNDELIRLCDENTIGIISILGNTYTGHFDDVDDLNTKVTELNNKKGYNIGIHVDAATGGFIAPFLYPELKWDFRLKNVWSINTSGHKYGLVYPGVGFIVWRDDEKLPKDLIFDLHYLGGVEQTFTLNFSKPSSQVVLQYYNMLRLGRDGYKKVIKGCKENAIYLKKRLESMGPFEVISSDNGTPLVTCRLKESVVEYTVFDLERKLKEFGWITPAYQLPEGAEQIYILRMVVRESFSVDMASKFIDAMQKSIDFLMEQFASNNKKKAVESNKKHKKVRSAKMHVAC
eukprot:NODE_247_length_12991_cov_0.678328.p2 type:complete len:482 gc:universal NODE_247_length_12991_cov_0.678328:1422-2867(+)